MKRIERREYLSKLKKFRAKKLIKVVTGIRRCGKSTLMEIFRDWLITQGVNSECIVFINFEDYDFFSLRDPQNLYSYVKKRLRYRDDLSLL